MELQPRIVNFASVADVGALGLRRPQGRVTQEWKCSENTKLVFKAALAQTVGEDLDQGGFEDGADAEWPSFQFNVTLHQKLWTEKMARFSVAGHYGRETLDGTEKVVATNASGVVAQLVKAEVGLEVACVDIGGWDTHANQVVAGDTTNGNMATRMRELAGGISALITDLHDRFESGATKQGVTVVVMSEFGRRAFENGGTGTDHGHGNVMFTFGRGIKGHKVYTNRWPGLADDDLDRGDLARTTEYRDVLGEILLKRTGNTNIADVFPGHAFNFLGLANDLGPTVAPTNTPAQPTAVPTTPPEPTTPPVGPSHRIFIPNVGNK